jgi:hypothetical protein
LIFSGIVLAFVPILPGPLFVFAGIFLWAWTDNFQRIGWPLLVLLFVIMILAWSSELVLETLCARRTGASWKTVASATIGGLIGAIVGSGVASIFTAIIGSILGVLLAEYLQKRQVQPALRASGNYLIGCLLGRIVELTLSLLMITIFVWRVFG